MSNDDVASRGDELTIWKKVHMRPGSMSKWMGVCAILLLFACAPSEERPTNDSVSAVQQSVQVANFETTTWGGLGTGDGALKRPTGLAVEPNNVVVVVDSGNARLQRFSATGVHLGTFGVGAFSVPWDCDRAPDGTLYVTDYQDDVVKKVAISGAITTFVDSSAGLHGPRGVAVGPNGSVFVADYFNHRVVKFDEDGSLVWEVGGYGGGPESLAYPTAVALDEHGNVHVADYYNHRIQKWDANAVHLHSIGSLGDANGELNKPLAVAVDRRGFILAADWLNHRVQIFDVEGSFLSMWGSDGAAAGEFGQAMAMDVAADGTIFVADYEHHKVQAFKPNPIYQYEGTWGSLGSDEGKFKNPSGIAMDHDGNVVVADSGNGRVQKFTSDGQHLSAWGGFTLPWDVDVDSNNEVVVTDYGDDRIMRISSDDTISEVVGHAAALDGPRGISLGVDDSIHVSDYFNHRIVKFASHGAWLWEAGSYGGGPTNLAYPNKVDVGLAGEVFVADYSNHRVQVWDEDGSYVRQLGDLGSEPGQYNKPSGLAVDQEGALLVTERNNHRVQVLDSNGRFLDQWGSRGTSAGEFENALAIAVGRGKAYVADYANHRIQSFSRDPCARALPIDSLPAIFGVSEVAFLVEAPISVDASVTVPPHIDFCFGETGALDIAPGIEVALQGDVFAGRSHIFREADATSRLILNRDVTLYPEWFGGVGDGATNDSAAFRRLSAAIEERDGGNVLFASEATYLVGEQTYNPNPGPTELMLAPQPVLFIKNLTEPLVIDGNGAKMRLQPGLWYCTFDPVASSYPENPVPADSTTNPHDYNGRADVGTMVSLTENLDVTVKNLELDGAMDTLVLGGLWGDAGRQCHAVGIIADGNVQLKVTNVYTHHHGLDGMIIVSHGIQDKDDPGVVPHPHLLEDVRSQYNARQGLSVVGSNDLTIRRSDFSFTGRGRFHTAPRAGIDLEGEGGAVVHDTVIEDTTLINNMSYGLVADSGPVEDVVLRRVRIVGSYAMWADKPGVVVEDSHLSGYVVNLWGDADPSRATQFRRCEFDDVDYFGNASTYGTVIEWRNGENILVEDSVLRTSRAHGFVVYEGLLRNVVVEDGVYDLRSSWHSLFYGTELNDVCFMEVGSPSAGYIGYDADVTWSDLYVEGPLLPWQSTTGVKDEGFSTGTGMPFGSGSCTVSTTDIGPVGLDNPGPGAGYGFGGVGWAEP